MHSRQTLRKCSSVLLQSKSATQGTMLVAMLPGSKSTWTNKKNYFG